MKLYIFTYVLLSFATLTFAAQRNIENGIAKEMKKKIEKAEKKYNDSVKRAIKSAIKKYEEQIKKWTKKGDLTGALATKKKIAELNDQLLKLDKNKTPAETPPVKNGPVKLPGNRRKLKLNIVNGTEKTIKKGARIWLNRPCTFLEYPARFEGMTYASTPLENCAVEIGGDGEVFAFVSTFKDDQPKIAPLLKKAGWKKLPDKPFKLFKLNNIDIIYEVHSKKVKKDEKINFPKGMILVY